MSSTPNIGIIQPHLSTRMKSLIRHTTAGDPDRENIDELLNDYAKEYMQMLGALNDSAQVVGSIQSVFDYYMHRMTSEDPGGVLISAMKDLRLASSWR